ncbi:MAG: hypothetical protein KC912_26250, partial [Proteobacteria bacterium]|nr:hypothetical protein [Pseudomonadota bacterium]
PGFIAQEREVLIDGVTEVEVTLAEEPKPVKKPKPPPREPVAPPVGNLMPPPDIGELPVKR